MLEVACSAREDYLPHTATMIASLLANAGTPARIHLLVGDDVGDAETASLGTMVEGGGGDLVIHRIEGGRLDHLKTTNMLPTSHWYRVLLPELLDAPRALYLDGDTIVVDSLRPLAELDLAGDWLAATTNPFPDPGTAAQLCAGLGVSPNEYFNSGVMLLDLEAMRHNDVTARVLAFAMENSDRLFLPEQDAMNAVLVGHRMSLAPRWNSMIGLPTLDADHGVFGTAALREARESPAIRHFEGSGANKPWHPAAGPEARRLYQEYRSRTPWPDLADEA